MTITILDCYTDEPAGLGVPPYLGVYPRYIAGSLGNLPYYITIDDLRFYKLYSSIIPKTKISKKTNIKIYNLTSNCKKIKNILEQTSTLIVILGIHTPGKYLSAVPGTLKEVISLIRDLKCEKILTGPVFYGTSLEGGKFFEKADLSVFDKVEKYDFSYDEIKEYSINGASIIKQIPDLRVIEIETGHGCSGRCSFCTEPIKHRLEFREINDITNEIKSFYELGCRYFRLGKQSCFYTYPKPVELLQKIKKETPDIGVLHIDNVNPNMVLGKRGEEITKAIVKYCTSGNVAAFGVESFDRNVIRENNLNTTPETAFEAVKIINK
jgi:radical SAM superfamily enzyme with C-terminal helix-hairpin-helix motif